MSRIVLKLVQRLWHVMHIFISAFTSFQLINSVRPSKCLLTTARWKSLPQIERSQRTPKSTLANQRRKRCVRLKTEILTLRATRTLVSSSLTLSLALITLSTFSFQLLTHSIVRCSYLSIALVFGAPITLLNSATGYSIWALLSATELNLNFIEMWFISTYLYFSIVVILPFFR